MADAPTSVIWLLNRLTHVTVVFIAKAPAITTASASPIPSSIKFHWSKTNFALRKNVSKREAHNARIVTKDAIGDIGTVERGVAKEALEKVFDLDECGKFAHISGFVYIGKEFWASKQEWAKARNWKVR
jgi:hypothetical protein